MLNITEFVQNRTFRRHHEELREFWHAKLLIHVHEKGDRRMAAVIMSVIAHRVDNTEALVTLLQCCFPGFAGIKPPFYASSGKVMKTGEVAADLMCADNTIVRNTLVFKSKREMEAAFRTLADELALDDEDRVAMFAAVKAWIVADYGLDPNRTRDP